MPMQLTVQIGLQAPAASAVARRPAVQIEQ
jgi:hypothetical protein